MAARKLTPLGIVVKWIVVPAALAALGYYVVGPRLGEQPVKAKAPEAAPKGQVRSQEIKAKPPEVEVASEPSKYGRAKPGKSSRSRRATPERDSSAP